MTGLPIWYELMTPRVESAIEFYRATLGWEVQRDGTTLPNGSEYRMIGRPDGGNAGGVLTLPEPEGQGSPRPGWMVYFHVADVDASVTKAQELGARVHMPPMTMDGVGRMAMIADPQGAPFYLLDPQPPANQPDARSDVFAQGKPGHCWWNELETTDEPAAAAFYKPLFGWSMEEAMPMGDKGLYRFIEHDGKSIGAINPWRPENTPVCWLPYFGVAEIESARAAAEAAGGTVTHGVHEVPGGDFIFVAIDPAGAAVGFVGPKAA